MTRHQTLSGRLHRAFSRDGFYGLWITLAAALGSWQGFTYVVVHNGPLWRLCGGCRAIRRHEPVGPPPCDCHEDEGAVHLTLVMNPKRRSGTVTIGHTRFGADAAIEYLRAGDDLAAWQPQWLSEAQEELLRQLIFDLYEEREP